MYYSPGEDPFVTAGLSEASVSSDSDVVAPRRSSHVDTIRLSLAGRVREKLKRRLFRAKEQRRQQRTARHREVRQDMFSDNE